MRSGGAHGQADHVCRGNCPCWHAVQSGSRRLTFGHGSCRFHISEGSSPAKRPFIGFGKGTFSRKHRLDTVRHLESTHQILQSSRRRDIQTSSGRERATFASTLALFRKHRLCLLICFYSPPTLSQHALVQIQRTEHQKPCIIYLADQARRQGK